MNEDGVRVTRIDWLTAIPSLRLCEAVRCAISPRALIPAALFVYLYFGSAAIFRPWFESSSPTPAAGGLSNLGTSTIETPRLLRSLGSNMQLFGRGPMPKLIESYISLGAMMLVFGFSAIPVMRSVGCRICLSSSSGLLSGVKLSVQSWKEILLSTLLSLILLAVFIVTFRTSRWIGSVTFESIESLAALFFVIACFVLSGGWFLSLAAIAIDRCDGAEALSRGISYMLSRWQRVIVYTVAGLVLIEITNIVFWWLASAASPLIILAPVTNASPSASPTDTFHHYAHVLRLSVFLCEIAIAYVLLRNVEDGVSLREIDGGKTIA
jgi:hypothetical protein